MTKAERDTLERALDALQAQGRIPRILIGGSDPDEEALRCDDRFDPADVRLAYAILARLNAEPERTT